jgi:predicted O-linked N-acetylglucosamine transferase (SPINDLY family)
VTSSPRCPEPERQGLAPDPRGPEVRRLHDLAEACARDVSRQSEAVVYSREAHRLAPQDPWLCAHYGRDLIYAGHVEQGIVALEAAARLDPNDACLQLNCLGFRHYLPSFDREGSFRAYCAWGERFASLAQGQPCHRNSPDPDRRLRIGYVSPGFCTHSIARTFEPILDAHDRGCVEVFGYGNVPSPDDVTERFTAQLDRYRDIHGQTAQAIADQIRADEVDLLVGVGGHCTGNRLDVLALRPAPVQVDLGSVSTTGIRDIEYRITDAILDPPETQSWYVERLVPLAGGFVSYRPPLTSPAVEPLPFQSRGFITWGSFNNHIKINDAILNLWSQVLARVAGSRLVLKFPSALDPGLQQHYRGAFESRGVAADRISFIGERPHFEHLRSLGQVDVALDTFPFNGCVTTLEGLWMGVPIVSLAGQTYVSRVGLDILTRLGLEAFAARTPDEFVAKACAAASRPESLAALRRGLRERMLASGVCDPGRFSRELEEAYRWMWRARCEGQSRDRGPSKTAPARPASLGRAGGPSGLSDLGLREGRLSLTAESVPACLLEVNQKVCAGQIDQARQVLDGRLQEVEASLAGTPERTDVMFILAKLLADCGRAGPAEVWLRRVALAQPHAQVWDQLARLCFCSETRWTEGAEFSRRAWEAMPEDVPLALHWAWSLVRTGQLDRGLEVLANLAAAHPQSSEALTTWLWFQHYADHSRRQISDGYRRWAARFAPLDLACSEHANDPDPDRRLRIGYVSGDFRTHATAYATELILAGHEPRQVEVFGYGNVACPDAVTARFVSRFDHYRNIRGHVARDVADQIRQDRIDVLIGIGGHVTDSRMDVLALKPAPVQGDLGGISTTGMSQVDFRVTDAILDPADALDAYVEESIYLPGGLACFQPPSVSPPPGPLPALTHGRPTFGSVNSNPKINSGCIALWARVLRETPGSSLILKFNGGADADVRALYVRQFEAHGVDGRRIEVIGQLPFPEYLAIFQRMDLLLDTHPYNGCITTLEGLWMGVPIVTLTGQTYVSRVGLSILSRLGLEVFAAQGQDEYVAKAAAFAAQPAELALIRRSLRSMMLAGPLCDPARMGRELEQAYRSAWQHWCLQRQTAAAAGRVGS